MALNSYQKPTTDPVTVPLNHRNLEDNKVTIFNNTGASLTITATAQDVQTEASPTFTTPAQGALSIAAGAFGVLSDPYGAFLAAGTGTGSIDIVETY